MDSNLCETLVKKKLICEGTKILATIRKVGIGGAMSTKQTNLIIESIDDWLFTCIDPETKHKHEIIDSQILDVDGMVPERLGKIFNINPDGTLRAPGKKRGRKPKK